jgi:cation transport ATPase
MDLTPKIARVRRDGNIVQIPAEEIQVKDIFVVRRGESMPTDGVVESGSAVCAC